MSALRSSLVALLALVACSKSDGQSADEPLSKHVPAKQLIGEPRVKTAGSVAGHAFSIEVPADLYASDTKASYVSWEVKGAFMDMPSLTVRFVEDPLTSDDLGDATPIGDDAAVRVIVKREPLPGGGFINLDERTDHHFFALTLCRPVPGARVCCDLAQRDDHIEAFDESVAWAEAVCRSLVVR